MNENTYYYIIIFEDGAVKKATTISDRDEKSCSDGYLQIINIIDFTEFDGELWIPLKSI
jgi:hypothetical protein